MMSCRSAESSSVESLCEGSPFMYDMIVERMFVDKRGIGRNRHLKDYSIFPASVSYPGRPMSA